MEGTIIQATLRPEDLIPAFYRALEELAPATAKARREGTYGPEIEAALDGGLDSYIMREGIEAYTWVAETIETLASDLDANAPEGYYFGTLEGDGSDFGFWKDEDALS